MTDGTVPERVRDALIKIVATAPDRPCQYSWGGWIIAVRRLVPDFKPDDLLAVFKLMNGDMLKLTKPGNPTRHYSGDKGPTTPSSIDLQNLIGNHRYRREGSRAGESQSHHSEGTGYRRREFNGTPAVGRFRESIRKNECDLSVCI